MTEHERRFRETVLLCYRSSELVRHAHEVITTVKAALATSRAVRAASRAARAASRVRSTETLPVSGPYGPH